MNLPPRNLTLKRILVRDRPVLALDTGFDPTSLEGLRIVKASRGSGWFWHDGTLQPWTTRGIQQEDRRLVVWGDLETIPDGEGGAFWPQEGEEGKEYLRAFVIAWTARAAAHDPMPVFGSSAILPYKTAQGWAFAFPPPELLGVLDSLQPLSERLAWDHFRLPEGTGVASWSFASAALGVNLASGTLPWAQEDETHLRQEIRDLKRTLTDEELPPGPDPATLHLWFDSLTSKAGPQAAERWKIWASAPIQWKSASEGASSNTRPSASQVKRETRRDRAQFWRRRGTLVTSVGVGVAVLLSIVGSMVWSVIKPDETDTYTPAQVVQGYYAAITDLDADRLGKLLKADKAQFPEVGRDVEEATNLYVIRQVRIAYEQTSPILNPDAWEAAGKPPLGMGKMVYGVAGLQVASNGNQWTATYRKWTSEVKEGQLPLPVGVNVKDQLTLTKTDRGWKVIALVRETKPLP